jgi:hypothetical protein
MPDQIAKFWPQIKESIEESVPPLSWEKSDRTNNILQALLEERMQCWAAYRKYGETDSEIVGIVLTTTTGDGCSGTVNFLLYSVFGYNKTNADDWIEGFQTLGAFASALGCKQIVAYTRDAKLIELAKKFGADTSYTFISVPI